MADDPDDILRLDRQICFPLYAASNLMTRHHRPLLSAMRLTYPQYLVMLLLWEASPIQMGELCKRLYLDSGTLTPMLKRMEASGFIERLRDPADERRLIVRITPQGEELKVQARAVPRALAARFGGRPAGLDSLRDAMFHVMAQLSSRLDDA